MYQRNAISGEFLSIKAIGSLFSQVNSTLYLSLRRCSGNLRYAVRDARSNVVIQSFLYKVSLNPLISNLPLFENFILEFSASQNEQS